MKTLKYIDKRILIKELHNSRVKLENSDSWWMKRYYEGQIMLLLELLK